MCLLFRIGITELLPILVVALVICLVLLAVKKKN